MSKKPKDLEDKSSQNKDERIDKKGWKGELVFTSKVFLSALAGYIFFVLSVFLATAVGLSEDTSNDSLTVIDTWSIPMAGNTPLMIVGLTLLLIFFLLSLAIVKKTILLLTGKHISFLWLLICDFAASTLTVLLIFFLNFPLKLVSPGSSLPEPEGFSFYFSQIAVFSLLVVTYIKSSEAAKKAREGSEDTNAAKRDDAKGEEEI